MIFFVTIEMKHGYRHKIDIDSDDPDSVCYAMGFIQQALKDGDHVAKIDHN